ncbi:hypothetical protein TNCV_1240061 [Trichonephila clavipes]|uniref:Uncharacterized protein n=1 Tax=Trichonephila clavipes TaxID=2585209 RepID=A0A8X7BK04_TRICX|nr:hypothetical protein TNCV_1240061 [Trichonephila clavipes]
MLAKDFKKYFLDEDSLVASYEWIRDLFQDTPEGLSTSEEEIFIDFTSSEKLKVNISSRGAAKRGNHCKVASLGSDYEEKHRLNSVNDNLLSCTFKDN